MSYDRFLSPGAIGSLTLKNRSIFPPMGSGYVNEDGTPKDQLIDYHVRRVLGGCAMNIVEIAAVHTTTQSPGILGIHDDKYIPGLTRLAAAINKAGGISCIQLWHGGRQTSGKPFGGEPFAPSEVTCAFIGEKPHAMTADEIHEVISAYGDAALRAWKAGFNAVEIHGAHGYLIDCFLNAYTNKRSDEYGGSLENRARFGCEVIRDVRAKVGKDYPVLMRMSARENVEGGIVLEDAIEAAKLYEAACIDAIDISQGCYDSLAYTVPPYYYPPKVNAYNASQIKKNLKIPVIVAGRITTPELAEEILKEGMADFISLGRPMLADPDFVKKTMENRTDDIVRCIACDQGCVGRMFAGQGSSCIFNPATGHEEEVVITPAEQKKKVLVIGGGPAGLEAARTAKMRGHDVVLFEKRIELGGQFLLAGYAPHKGEFAASAMHMGYRAMKAGVEIRLYTEATPEKIREINPDYVIVATGSDPLMPDIPGIDKPHVVQARMVIGAQALIAAEHVAVIGGGLVGLEAMEILTAQGKEVYVVEMADKIGEDLEMYIKPYVSDFIAKHHVKVLTDAKCKEIKDDHIVMETHRGDVRLPCEAVVIAVGSKSSRAAADMVESLGYPYDMVGDAYKPGKVLDAIWGGNAAARKI